MIDTVRELRALEKKQDYVRLIAEVKKLVKDDRRIFTQPYIKEWCGRRWRNLFINEAAKDPQAVKVARKSFGGIALKDKRSNQQRVAERYLRGDGPLEWRTEMPAPQFSPVSQTTLVFSPGLLTGMLPVQAFLAAFPALEEKYGYKILRSDSHPMRGCSANVADLMQAINTGVGLNAQAKTIPTEQAKAPDDLFFMGYSKGVPDVLTLLVQHPELKDRTRCVVNWAGAPGGSHLADNIYAAIKDLPLEAVEGRITDLLRMVSPVINFKGVMGRMHEFDIKGAIKDLTLGERAAFNAAHSAALDALDIPIFNITGSTSPLEVPFFQVQGVLELNKYDANNDMQVTQYCAKVHLPMATDLAMLRGHHWDLSYSPFPRAMRLGSPNLDHPFPKEAAATALFQFVTELGLVN